MTSILGEPARSWSVLMPADGAHDQPRSTLAFQLPRQANSSREWWWWKSGMLMRSLKYFPYRSLPPFLRNIEQREEKLFSECVFFAVCLRIFTLLKCSYPTYLQYFIIFSLALIHILSTVHIFIPFRHPSTRRRERGEQTTFFSRTLFYF